MPQDSTGNRLEVGDKVRCRGRIYTVAEFSEVEADGRPYTFYHVHFEEPWDGEPADEMMVDKVNPFSNEITTVLDWIARHAEDLRTSGYYADCSAVAAMLPKLRAFLETRHKAP